MAVQPHLQPIIALKEFVLKTKADKAAGFLHELSHYSKILTKQHPDPLAQNALHFCCSTTEHTTDVLQLKEHVFHQCYEALREIALHREQIIYNGLKKIPKGGDVFVFEGDAIVRELLFRARQEKRFTVHLLEQRPGYKGREFAKLLSKENIPTIIYPDAAIRTSLKRADVALTGCVAFDSEEVVTHIGGEVAAELAYRFDVPFYLCTDAWKFLPEEKTRSIKFYQPEDVWAGAPSKIKVNTHSYEKVNPALFTGVISQFGIQEYKPYLKEITVQYPWLLFDRRF